MAAPKPRGNYLRQRHLQKDADMTATPEDKAALSIEDARKFAHSYVDNENTPRTLIDQFNAAACSHHFPDYDPSPPTPQPPAKSRVLMGVNWTPDIPGVTGAAAKVDEWEKRTGQKIGCFRPYPAGKVGVAGLDGAKAAMAVRPGVPQVISSLVTGRNIDVVALAKEHEKFAQALGAKVYAEMDAEPEHERGRAYTEAQWCEQYKRWLDAHLTHAPSVEAAILNTTGYLYSQRIERFKSVFPLLKIVAVDPYWRAGSPSAIQAGDKDLKDAYEHAKAMGWGHAWGEWGIDPGDGHLDRCNRAQSALTTYRPIFAPYFQLSPTGTWDSRLLTPAEFKNYSNVLVMVAA